MSGLARASNPALSLDISDKDFKDDGLFENEAGDVTQPIRHLDGQFVSS